MNSKDLDRLFDESAFRTQKGTTSSGPYSSSPLASDHYLLKRSWDYFKSRIATIEEQWKKILESKEEELKVTLNELATLRSHMLDVEGENTTYKNFDREFERSKAEDFLAFKRNTDKLRTQWEEERQSFLDSQSTLEMRVVELEGRIKKMKEESAAREEKWKQAIEVYRNEGVRLTDRHQSAQNEMMMELNLKSEELKTWENKAELLRGEVERRDQIIKDLQGDVASRERDISAQMAHSADLTHELRRKEEELTLLNERFAILSKEKEAMRESWSREQAEWRELWDRERELFDRNRRSHDEDVDRK